MTQFTHFNRFHTLVTVNQLFTSYDTVHTHFKIVHTHSHSMFTQYDTVHTL